MNTSTHRMFGALLVRRMPGAGRPTLNIERADQGLFLLWPDLDRMADADDPDVAHHAREALERLCEDMDSPRR